ncbi:uncharacterized protein LOC113278469 [Papaver somniferum]|uniref:uncharacterized protein LOC113278469 n=1 Tax=Papaver somniferum TaxID=3469 RepID=UPI000E7020A8|nr:uncharacterized protein LOC113278469 [Papaver somniferum]
MKMNSFLAKIVIAFWLVLEEMGYFDLIQAISTKCDSVVKQKFNETASFINYLVPNPGAEPIDTSDRPFLAGLIEIPFSRVDLYNCRYQLLERLNHIMQTVCNVIFTENEANKVEEAPSSSKQTQNLQSNLNPLAKPFSVPEPSTPTDQRSMFLTFSNGFPCSREEIFSFFTSKLGPVVESVMLERAVQDAPQYARIVFTNESVISQILNGENKVKFMVNGKHLWARLYKPKKN